MLREDLQENIVVIKINKLYRELRLRDAIVNRLVALGGLAQILVVEKKRKKSGVFGYEYSIQGAYEIYD